MVEADLSWYTQEDMFIGRPYDPRHKPLPIPENPPFFGSLTSLCLNPEWWPHIAGLLERLRYTDAWLNDDQEQQQLAVQYITQIIDKINQRNACMPAVTLVTDCGCNVVNYIQEIDNYNSWYAQNTDIFNYFGGEYTSEYLPDNSTQTEAEVIAEAAAAQPPPAWKICQASTMLFYWLHDIGIAAREGKINFSSPVPLLDKVSDWIAVAFTVGELLLKVFPTSQAIAATVGTVAQIAWIADDIAHFAGVISSSDFSENQINDFICILFEAMSSPGAGFSTFEAIDYLDTDMNNIWQANVDAELYGAFLALVDDPEIAYKFYCCTDCEDTFAGINQIISGEVHEPDRKLLWLPPYVTGGGVTTRQMVVRVHLKAPAKIRYVQWYMQGITYFTPYILSVVQVTVATDTIPGDKALVWETGLPYDRTALERGNYYIAPPSVVGGGIPASNWFEIKAQYGYCSACTSTQLAQLAKAWAFMSDIRYCVE